MYKVAKLKTINILKVIKEVLNKYIFYVDGFQVSLLESLRRCQLFPNLKIDYNPNQSL